jgi:transposase
MRELARRYQTLTAEGTRLQAALTRLTSTTAPRLVATFGAGPDVAGALLTAAGDNPGRLRNERAFARLCGAAPLEASSGRTRRPGSIGAATAMPTTRCGASSWSACTTTRGPRPTSPAAPPKDCPSARSSAA